MRARAREDFPCGRARVWETGLSRPDLSSGIMRVTLSWGSSGVWERGALLTRGSSRWVWACLRRWMRMAAITPQATTMSRSKVWPIREITAGGSNRAATGGCRQRWR